MSSIVILGTGGGGGGGVNTLTGNVNVATAAANNINTPGAHGINTVGAASTLTIAIDNTIELGDLAVVTAGNDALTITSGDITVSGTGVGAGGNLNMPATSSADIGVAKWGGVPFIHNYGTQNTFIGSDAGNFTLTVANATENVCVGFESGAAITEATGAVFIGNRAGFSATTAAQCTYVGNGAGALSEDTEGCTGIGWGALQSLTSAGPGVSENNTAVGSSSLFALSTGINNTVLGRSAAASLDTGSYNTAIGRTNGSAAGSAYAGAESSNLVIMNDGVLGESNTIRIGDTGAGNAQQNRCFIAGIAGVNVGSVATVVSISGDQLGQATITAGTGISVTAGANSITIASTAAGFPWTEVTGTTQAMAINNGYIANNAGLVTLTLPATAAVGSIIEVVGKGAGGWRVAQNAGQTIHFVGIDTTTGAGGYIEDTVRYDCVTLICTTADTDWVVKNSVGNLTVV